MALPKKKNGFRSITVNGAGYNWKFEKKIDIRPKTNKNNKLIVDFGWYDVWLFVNDKENEPLEYEPKKVTPAFVRKSIIEAIKLGWNSDGLKGEFNLRYKDGKFDKL